MAILRINAELWNKVSDENKEKIREILTYRGLITRNDLIEGDPSELSLSWEPELDVSAATFDEVILALQQPNKQLCVLACTAAEAAAVAGCVALGEPTAIAACMVLAHKGGDMCRGRC